MSRKYRAKNSSDVSRDAPASENSDAMEVQEPVPPLSVTIDVEAEFAAALLRVTGHGSGVAARGRFGRDSRWV